MPAFCELPTLAAGGYGAVNIRTVAEKYDVAPATLYYYFPSKGAC